MKTFKVTVDGHTYTVQVEELAQNETKGSGAAEITKSKPASSGAVPVTAEKPALANNQSRETSVPTTGGGFKVKAPMPGSVIEVKVKVGDTVSDGDVLLVLEAMKMENELTASQAGTVTEVLVKKGDTVNSGDPLIIMS